MNLKNTEETMRLSALLITLSCLLLLTVSARAQEEPRPAGLDISEGLEITLFASEDQIFSPASIDIDERGRLWVLETVNYRKKTREGGDRVLILEDRDGDGKCEAPKVFYQGHDIDGGHGICVLGNQVIVSVSDRILRLTDTDGDDVSDEHQVLFRGELLPKPAALRGTEDQHDHAIHAVCFGPDGRLYFNFGNYTTELQHADGSPVEDIHGHPINNTGKPYRQGMVIRCELDGSKVEVLGHNFRNNWEVAVDSFGVLWQSDNDNGSSSCRVNYVMEGGNFGYTDEMTGMGYQNARTNMEDTMQRQMWHQNDPGVVPNLLITGRGAPTGMVVYEGDLLPEKYRGQMLHAETGQRVVWSFPVEKQGAGYSAVIADLVRGREDANFRPCDISVAPDGSLFIADWYDPVDCCHRALDDTGRIFRIAPPGHAHRVPGFDFQSPEGAARALRNPNLAVRYRAWTALHEMGGRALKALEDMAADPNPRFRARALWLLAANGKVNRAIELALKDPLDDVRALTLRIARRHNAEILPMVEKMLHDPSALVRRECALSLRGHATPEAADLWASLALQHDGKDRWYLEALGIGEAGNEDACFATWLERAGESWNSPAGRDIIWRSRGRQALKYLAKLLLEPGLPEADRKRFMRAFDFHSTGAKEQPLLSILSAGPESGPWTFSEALRRTEEDTLNSRPELVKQLRAAIPACRGTSVFVDLVGRFNRRDLAPDLMEMALSEPGTDAGTAAIRQLLTFGEQDRIAGELDTLKHRDAVLQALRHADNGPAAAMLKSIVVDESRPLELRLLAVDAMGLSNRAVGRLGDLVSKDALPGELLEPALRVLSMSPYSRMRRIASEKRLQMHPGGQEGPSLKELMALIPDRAKGKAAFQKAACATCHVIDGEGIDFGPELSAIGDKLQRSDLFAAILLPDQSISLGYEGVMVKLNDGSQFAGYVSGESETTLSLRMMGGIQQEIDLSRIKTRKNLPTSLMPAGLTQTLSNQELADLVGWLQERRAPKHK